MTKIDRRNMIALLGAAPFVAGALTQAQTPDKKPRFQTISSRERIKELYFPNLLLTTHEGRKVRFYDDLIKDKIVIMNFMYAKCDGICMPVTMNLLRVKKLLGNRVGKDIFMYSFTLKPEEDTPKKLAHYAHMHKTGPGWQFLTGAPADLELLRRKLGYTDPDPVVDRDKSNHVGAVKFGNEPLERWGGCAGLSKPSLIVKNISWVDWPKNSALYSKNGGGQ